MQAGSTEYLGSYVKVVHQKIQMALPKENFPEQFFAWISPFIEDGTIVRFPQNLYVPIVIGPSGNTYATGLEHGSPLKSRRCESLLLNQHGKSFLHLLFEQKHSSKGLRIFEKTRVYPYSTLEQVNVSLL